MSPIRNWLIERIGDYGDRPFLSHGGRQSNYAELGEKIERCATSFREAGIQPGDVATLYGDYSLEAIAALLALFQLGAIAVPVAIDAGDDLNTRQEEARAVWHIDASGEPEIRACQQQGDRHELVEKLAARGEAGLVLFSSGSTGRPKAMIHSVDSLLAPFAKKRARKHCILIFLLFDHIGGLNTLFNGLSTGAKLVVPDSRSSEDVASAIEKNSVNLLPTSPTFLNLLLMSGAVESHDLSSLRFITYGTEPMPEALLARIKEALPNASLIQTFGTSETGISKTASRSSDSTLLKFDDPNTEYRIVEGELWLRSKSQIMGYLNHNMKRFTEDGWFKTGDLAEEAEGGYIKIVGRREDLINVGGEKVTPSEVESVLLELPEVADCIVFAEANAITGQNVAAEVVASQGSDPRELKRRIKKHCREKLAAFKVPARIRLTTSTSFSTRFKKMRRKDTD